MRFSAFATAAALASTVSAAEVFKVSVGKEQFKFTPEFVNAKKGDTVMFIFHPKNHTITQSSFGQPCENYTQGGLDSGFIGYDPKEPPKTLQVWNVTVDDDVKPKWFSCRQRVDDSSTHCSKGMVFSINPNNGKTPTGEPTSADGFKKLALAAKPSVAAVEGTSSGSSSSSASSSGSASASATDSASKSDATSASGSSSASDSKTSSGSSSGTASSSSGSAKATGAGTSSAAAQTDAGKPSLPSSSSSTPATSSSASSPASASTTSAAGSLARNTAGALTAVGIALAFLL